MKLQQLLIFALFTCLAFLNLSAQNESDDRTYEVRYWQNMNNTGNNPIHVDTMVYYGRDRTGFDYSNADCISYFCKEEDNMLYSVVDKFETNEKEWNLVQHFVRKMDVVNVPFKGKSRKVYWVFVSDLNNRNSGVGTYSLVSKEFGVICRWNSDGEFFQLNRIDLVKNNRTLEELDLIPLMDKLYQTKVFRN